MYNKKMLQRIETSLNEVQEKCTARTLSIDEIKGLINDFEPKVHELLSLSDKFDLVYVYHQGENCGGFGHSSTVFECVFHKNGNIKNFDINRYLTSGYVNRIEIINFNKLTYLEKKLLKKHYDVNNYGYINL